MGLNDKIWKKLADAGLDSAKNKLAQNSNQFNPQRNQPNSSQNITVNNYSQGSQQNNQTQQQLDSLRNRLKNDEKDFEKKAPKQPSRVKGYAKQSMKSFGSGILGAAGLAESSEKASNTQVNTFVWIVIISHVIDNLTGFDHQGLASFWWAWGIGMIFVAALLLRKPGEGFLHNLTHKGAVYAAFSALTIFAPKLMEFLPAGVQDQPLLNFGFMLLPMWMIYLVFVDQHVATNWVRKFYYGIFAIILLGMLVGFAMNTEVPTELQGNYDFNPMETTKDVYFDFQDSMTEFFERIISVGPGIIGSVNSGINDSIGINYQSQVDSSASKNLGVRFEDLYPNSDTYYEGDQGGAEVVVWADIVGESLYEPINLAIACYAQKRSEAPIEGELMVGQYRDPTNIMITNFETISASCTFPNLPPGRYKVYMTATFNSRTWAYLTYYFAPYDLVQQYKQEKRDIIREAGFAEMGEAKQSPGPVQLGIANKVYQPIAIRDNGDLNTRYGASVGDAWQGELNSVSTIELMVSEPFRLIQCDHTPKQGTKENPEFESDSVGYRRYIFNEVNESTVFKSVNCFLTFDGSTDGARNATAQEFVQSYDLIQRTFGAETTYLYSIEDEISITVRERGS